MPQVISQSRRPHPILVLALAVVLVATAVGCRFSYSYRVYGNTSAINTPSVSGTRAAAQPQNVIDGPQRSIKGTITAVDAYDARFLRVDGGPRALDIQVTLAGDEIMLPRNAVGRRATVLGSASIESLSPDEADAALSAEGKTPRGEALSRLHVVAESLMIEPVTNLEPPRRRMPSQRTAPESAATP